MLRFMVAAMGFVALGVGARAEPVALVYRTPNPLNLPDKVDRDGGHVVKVADVVVGTAAPRGFTLVATVTAMRRDGRKPIGLQATTVPEGAGPPEASQFTSPPGASHHFSTAASGTVILQLFVRYAPSLAADGSAVGAGPYTAALTVTAADN